MSGYKVMLGYEGGHGWYRSDQNKFNWEVSAGTVGLAWVPDWLWLLSHGMIMGAGANVTAYTPLVALWRYWMWADTYLN